MSRALLLLLLSLLTVSACVAQEPPVGEAVVSMRFLHHAKGIAVWDCKEPEPSAWINITQLSDSIDMELTTAHELNHFAVMRSFPSCKAYKRWRKGNGAVFEAMAFCAAAERGLELGIPLETSLFEYSKQLSANYPFGLSQGDAMYAIMIACEHPIYLAATGREP